MPRPFCGGCGSPLPWATREDRVNAMKAALSLETGLDEANRIDLDAEIEVFAIPEDVADPDEQVRVAQKLKRLTPRVWTDLILPVLSATLSAEVRLRLGLPPS